MQWGEEEYFPKPIISGQGELVVATDGAVYMGDGCNLERITLDGWTGRLSGQDGSLILERYESGSRLWQIGRRPRIFWELERASVDSFLSDEQMTLVAVSSDPITLYRLDEEGHSDMIVVEDSPSGDYTSLRLSDPVWFTVSNQTGSALYELVDGRAEVRVSAASVIHGPVLWDDGVAWLQDGRLIVYSDEVSHEVSDVDWKCLKQVRDTIYACSDRDLIEVVPTSAAYETHRLFDLTELTGVEPGCPDLNSEIYTDCQRQWYHYASEAGLLIDESDEGDERDEGDESDESDESDDASCMTLNLFKTKWSLIIMLIFMVQRRWYLRNEI
jgi:hypothetical protein